MHLMKLLSYNVKDHLEDGRGAGLGLIEQDDP
jgi:hypothetical protein